MRKDYENNEKLRGIFYSTYKIKGLNLDRLLNYLVKSGVECFNTKKLDNKTLILTVKNSKRKKLFAITDKLCYNNITKVKEGGFFYPLLYLKRNIGVFLGATLFLLISVFCNDLIFSFEYLGTGSVYSQSVEGYLLSKGVTTFSRFSDINLSSLADGILKDNDEFSFVSIVKKGNRMQVTLTLKTKPPTTVTQGAKSLISSLNGVVKEIKVYRGTAIVNVGDNVKVGDTLVDGYALVREEKVEVNVLATVSILTEEEIVYKGEKEGQEDIVLSIIEAGLDYLPYSTDIKYRLQDGEHTYIAKIKRLCVLCSG